MDGYSDLERRLDRALERIEERVQRLIAEHRDDVHEELAGMHRRIDEVHERALRELTRLHERRLPE